jgi:hypothetical protein
MRYDSDELLSILNFMFNISIAITIPFHILQVLDGACFAISYVTKDSKNVSGLLQE